MPQHGQATLRLHAPRGHALRDVGLVAIFLLGIAAFLATTLQP